MIRTTIILVIGLYSQCVLSGSLVNVRLPFLSPAGVTYINGPTPTGLVAGPVAIPARYAQPQFAAQYTAPLQYAAPAQYSGPAAYAAQPAFSAPLLRAAPVHHVPAVADIPVTQYEAHHGFVQKLVDVAKPALKTRKFEVRRPAIQKHFYDIEERIIVRPAGSALVELDQPTSKNQKGADIITPVLPAVPAVPIAARLAIPHQNIFVSSTPSPFVYSTVAGISPVSPLQFAPQYQHEQQSNPPQQQQQPQQEQQPQNNYNPADNEDNNDSVVVEARSNFGQIKPQQSQRQEQQQSNPHLETEVRFRSLGSQPPAARFNLAQPNDEQQQQQQFQQQEQENPRSNEQRNFNSPQFLPRLEQNQQQQNEPQLRNAPQDFEPEQNNDQNQQQQEPQPEQQQRFENQPRQLQRGNFEQQQQQDQNQASQPSPNVIFRNAISEEESQNNQQRLIRLLTENDGISELDQFEGRKFSFRGDSGLLRARILQFNEAGPNAKATDERVNTRRVVLSRPIETVQEIDVVEPITKIHKVAFNEPTIFKTARLGYQRVHTSFPALPVHAQYSGFHH